MHIIVVSYDLSRDKIGGVQNRMYRFVSGLDSFKKITQVTVFNFFYLNPFYYSSKKISINNYSTLSELYLALSSFISKNNIDILYTCDFRFIKDIKYFQKDRPDKIIASVPDIEQFRVKYNTLSVSKLDLEKKAFNYINTKNLDAVHLSSPAFGIIFDTFCNDSEIEHIYSPVGLPDDKQSYNKNKKNQILISLRQKKLYEQIKEIKENIASNKISSKYLLFSEKNINFNLDKDITFKKPLSCYEKMVPYFNASLLNLDFTCIHSFANNLVEGAFFGSIPVINSKNFPSYDLFSGKVIYSEEMNSYSLLELEKKSKELFKFSRKKFDLNKNLGVILGVK